jgi:hypothetical protein
MRLKFRFLDVIVHFIVNFIVILTVILAVVCSTAGSLRAQESEGTAGGSELSFHMGSILPNQIDGVTEILPAVGGRYGFPLNYGAIELGFLNAHAYGVDYKLISASFRGEMTPMPDISTLFYIGPDFHNYLPLGETTRQSEWGFHVGTGVQMHMGGPFWLRGDMKFNMNPGTALSIGFGIAIRARASEEN